MPAPSQLAIATSSVRRLLKEESMYHKELVAEEAKAKEVEERVQKGEFNEEGNAEFILKQYQTAAEETRAVFGPLRKRIEEAVVKLEDQIAQAEETGAPAEEIEAAKTMLAEGKSTPTSTVV